MKTKNQTPVEWLYQHLFPKQLDGFSNEEWNKIDMAFEKAKEMESALMEELKDFEKWKEWKNKPQ